MFHLREIYILFKWNRYNFYRIVSLSLPVYLAETVHPEVRGSLGMMPATLGNTGVMLSYILGFWLDWSQLSLAGAVRF